jgi:hypothetical protein
MACAWSAIKAAMEPAVCKAVLMLPPNSRLTAVLRRPSRLPNQHRRLNRSRELVEVIVEASYI